MDEPSRQNNGTRTLIEWLESLAFSTAVIVLVFLFLFRPVTVSGTSMVPTLLDGDKIMLQGIGYTPQRGDVIVIDSYSNYGQPLVKRVIGVGGDTVDIDFDTGTVMVNGVALSEPYLGTSTNRKGDVTFPLTVPEGTVFVMGDNRKVSLDSRYSQVGFIDTRDILGKVIFRIFPLSKAGIIQ